MKFGIFYEHQLPRPWSDGDEHRLLKDALDQVQLADRLGYDYLWEVEHHFLEEYSHSSAPEVFLAAASQRTKQIRLAHGIIQLTTNHPARVAERVSTLDLISGGRVEFGIGEGSSITELHPFGRRFRDKRSVWEDAVRAIIPMFKSEAWEYHGEHFDFPLRNVLPKPYQKPHPPFSIAGGGRRVLSLAAREADIVGLNANLYAGVIDQRVGPSATPAATDEKLGWIREAAGDRFDDLELQTRVHIATITDDPGSFAELMAPALGISPDDALASPHVLAGSVGQCVETLLMWRERWGLSYIAISEDAMVEFAPVVDALAGV